MERPTEEQRRELGAFLLSRRARVRPRDVGLPDGPRRTPGLRREEVALLAGVSVSWYTWIEQGRDVQASAETIGRVATVLGLDRVETAHLFALALPFPAPPTPGPSANERLSAGLELLVAAMDPIPTYVRNSWFDILAWNRSVKALFVDYDALPPHERNTIRLLFLHPPYRDLILNWEALARDYVATLRARRARAIDKAPFDRLIAELLARSPDFAAWWPAIDVAVFGEGFKRLRHPTLGAVDYTYVATAPELRPDLSVVSYLLRSPDGDIRS